MKKYFVTGLIIFLPISLTIVIVVFLVHLLTNPFIGVMTKLLSATRIHHFFFLSREEVIRLSSQFIILIGIFLITILLGLLARWFFFRWVIHFGDRTIQKIPFVNKVYKTSQELVNTLFIGDKNSFKQVVLAPFPNSKIYCLGFISSDAPKACSATAKEDLITAFIPTTPNPTSGFLIMYKKEDLLFLDMKTEDAFKYVISCGVILPEGT